MRRGMGTTVWTSLTRSADRSGRELRKLSRIRSQSSKRPVTSTSRGQTNGYRIPLTCRKVMATPMSVSPAMNPEATGMV